MAAGNKFTSIHEPIPGKADNNNGEFCKKKIKVSIAFFFK
jgi:predicted nucleic acid binding AN1-type Zn finger protein